MLALHQRAKDVPGWSIHTHMHTHTHSILVISGTHIYIEYIRAYRRKYVRTIRRVILSINIFLFLKCGLHAWCVQDCGHPADGQGKHAHKQTARTTTGLRL